jgi:hypothetical protein
VFYQEFNINLPVYGVPDKLKDYATSKKDISNGVEVNPREEYRLHNEDKFPENGGGGGPSMSTAESYNSQSFNEVDDFNTEVKNSVA